MTYVRVPVDDILTIGDETAVPFEGEALLLSPLAARVYEWCARPSTLRELARSLEAAFGPPDDEDLLAATLSIAEVLVTRGLLACNPGGPSTT
jgi:hypothetical protein